MDPDYVNLALACPSGENFYPIERLKRLTAQVLRTQPDIFKSYTLPPGSIRLRTQIARRSLQLGMFLSADDIVLTHGTMEALSLAIMATTQAGDSIALEIPTFHNLYPLLNNLGHEPTNKPAPITPPILIIVIWRFESPSPNFFVLSLFIFHSLKIYP